MEWLLVASALFVALSNGANDNFKGFATVWGSDTLTYRKALALAAVATVAGSLASIALAGSLVEQFSGKGLVPDAVASAPLFILAVAAATAATVFLATRLGFPVSTTHALIGGLIGAGVAQAGTQVHFAQLADAFLLPLLVSPILSALLGMAAWRFMRMRRSEGDCACIVAAVPAPALAIGGTTAGRLTLPNIIVASDAHCDRVPTQARVSVSRSMDRLHVLSAMSICFARGVNDTPKLAALLVAAHLLKTDMSIVLIAVAMMIGGLLFARRVAETMSRRVTRMDHVQGLTANLITAALVLLASKLGLPVSTTHVCVGSIGGVGASAGRVNWQALRGILLSWVATLPIAAAVAWTVARLA